METSSHVQTYRLLGILAVAHAVAALALLFPAMWLFDHGGRWWVIRFWVGIVTIWPLWLFVLVLHPGRTASWLALFVFLAAAPMLLSFPRYNSPFGPAALGLPNWVQMNPSSIWRYYSAYFAGRAEAEKDIAIGVLAFESSGFGAGGPWVKILRERYNIEDRIVAGCIVNERIMGHETGYNSLSLPEIERRFGKGRIEAAQEEGAKLWAEENARDEQFVKEFTKRASSIPPNDKIQTKSIRAYANSRLVRDPEIERALQPIINGIESYVSDRIPDEAPPFTLSVTTTLTAGTQAKFETSAHSGPEDVYGKICSDISQLSVPQWTGDETFLYIEFSIRNALTIDEELRQQELASAPDHRDRSR